MSLAACLALAACNSGPSSSTPSGSASTGKDEAATLERKAEYIEGLLARRGVAAAILDDLISALPDRAWLTEVACDLGKVRVKGNAPSNNLVADYISRLEGSPSLTNVALRSSAMKIVKGRESQEFGIEAAAREVKSPSGSSDPLAARLEELEKALPSPQDNAEMLRDLQRLARDAGLQMTKFAPGAQVPGEFTSEWPVVVEVSGEPNELVRYLKGLSELPRLWVVDKFACRAVLADDPRSQIRASITAKTYFVR
jgi:type IV pilus assembly protein PilO